MKARTLMLAVIAMLFLCCTRVAYAEDNYPRLFGYIQNRSDGRPYLRSDGSIDTLMVRHYARHHMVTVLVAPFWPEHPEIITLMRDYNHDLKVLGYLQGGTIWPADNPPWAFFSLFWHTLQYYDGFMYTKTGELHPGMMVNWGNAACVDSLARLFKRVAVSRIFDGLFIDSIGIDVWWMGQGSNPPFDLERAGFHSAAQMDSARRVNIERMITYIHVEVPGFKMYLNCDHSTGADGILREGFDHGLVTFDQAMAADTTTLAGNARNQLKTEAGWSGPYTDDAMRDVRFTLGTACLGRWYMDRMIDTGTQPTVPDQHLWWYDEYSVEPKFHHSDTTGRYIGWLGAAVVPPVKFKTGLWRRDFPNGFVLVNPTGTPLTHDFGMFVWQIQGVRDPNVNRGQKVRNVTVPPHDARFYQRVPRPGRPNSFRPGGRTRAAASPDPSSVTEARAAYRVAQRTGDHYRYGSSVVVGRELLRLQRELEACKSQ